MITKGLTVSASESRMHRHFFCVARSGRLSIGTRGRRAFASPHRVRQARARCASLTGWMRKASSARIGSISRAASLAHEICGGEHSLRADSARITQQERHALRLLSNAGYQFVTSARLLRHSRCPLGVYFVIPLLASDYESLRALTQKALRKHLEHCAIKNLDRNLAKQEKGRL